MPKIILNDLTNLQNENTATTAINANNATLEDAIDNTISRDGTSPNSMQANLDLNSNKIINLANGENNADAVNLAQVNSILSTAVVDGIGVTQYPVSAAMRPVLAAASLVSARDEMGIFTDAPFYNILQFGAVGDGIVDDTAAIQATFDAAGSNLVLIPVGNFRTTSAIVTTHPVNVRGYSTGAGPGSTVDNSYASKIFMDGNFIGFDVRSIYPSKFENIMIRKIGGTGSTGIKLTPSIVGSSVANFKIINCAFAGVDTPIRVLTPGYGVVNGCYFIDWHTAAIYYETVVGTEASGGFITNNVFAGIFGTEGPNVYSEVGYTVIENNEMLGGDYTVWFNYKNFNAGYSRILNNTMENARFWNARFTSSDGSFASHILISGNEMGNSGSGCVLIDENTTNPAWLSNVQICNNLFETAAPLGASFLWLQACKWCIVSGNIIRQDGGANCTGININGASINTGFAQPIHVLDNHITGTSTRYSLQSVAPVVVRDLTGMTAAQLPANAANGSQIYVTNVQVQGAGPATGAMGILSQAVWRYY